MGTSFYYKKKCVESTLIFAEKVNQTYMDEVKDFHKTGIGTEELTKQIEDHRKNFEETMRYKNIIEWYCFLQMWHSQTTYGDETRYTVRCFVTDVLATVKPNKGMKARLPMLRYIN